jgi:hypothetical protein
VKIIRSRTIVTRAPDWERRLPSRRTHPANGRLGSRPSLALIWEANSFPYRIRTATLAMQST